MQYLDLCDLPFRRFIREVMMGGHSTMSDSVPLWLLRTFPLIPQLVAPL